MLRKKMSLEITRYLQSGSDLNFGTSSYGQPSGVKSSWKCGSYPDPQPPDRLWSDQQRSIIHIWSTYQHGACPLYCFLRHLLNSMAVLLLPSAAKAQAVKETKAAFLPWSALSFRYSCYMGILVHRSFYHGLAKALARSFSVMSCPALLLWYLCWLCPFMYLATTMGSIQNGLGKTGTTFLQNICVPWGSAWPLCCLQCPLFGIRGYLWGFLVSELLSGLFMLHICPPAGGISLQYGRLSF